MTVGGWFFPRRAGEQYFFFRGLPDGRPAGRAAMFRPEDDWVNFVLGTDSHGFLLGTINGNGTMPFPHVTLNEVPINAWSQLVVVKDARGYHDVLPQRHARPHRRAMPRRPARSGRSATTKTGEPVRLAMPLGGLIGEAWVFPRELSADGGPRATSRRSRTATAPALPAGPVALREMDAHPAAGLWEDRGGHRPPRDLARAPGAHPHGVMQGPRPDADGERCRWTREVVVRGGLRHLRPAEGVDPGAAGRPDAGLPADPEAARGPRPGGHLLLRHDGRRRQGHDGRPVRRQPGTPPEQNRDFAVDVVEAGYRRVRRRLPPRRRAGRTPGGRPYDTTDFYERFPDWSVHGKDAWDTMRAIDYLQTLDFVDPSGSA